MRLSFGVRPPGHFTQARPLALNLPCFELTSHVRHFERASLGSVPALHAVHAVCAAAATVPLVQRAHVTDTLYVVVELPAVSLRVAKVPAEHCRQYLPPPMRLGVWPFWEQASQLLPSALA